MITFQVSCLGDIINNCPTQSTSLYINCGGRSLNVDNKQYEGDQEPGLPLGCTSTESRWGFSNTGHFLDDNNRSLTYYSFCMHNGRYNVSLLFAETVFTNDTTGI